MGMIATIIEYIKEGFGLFQVIRDFFNKRKQVEVDKLNTIVEAEHKETEVKSEEAVKRMDDAGHSAPAFKSELDKLRHEQQSGDSG